ncbi:MAG: transcription elongation factor [Deltaproteobacteria bacterium]|nr:MAG: transcription elongation factor [Deltaproteobacteria bacterium]
MPSKTTTRKARQDLREGKSPSTAAGEFVREEIEHVREGKHGARSPKQAIAIGLSEARRAGIPLKPRGKSARKRSTTGRKRKTSPSPRRAAAARKALKREPHRTVSRRALSRQARSAARSRRKSR